MAKLWVVVSALAICMTLTVVSVAADKIALVCSGTVNYPTGTKRPVLNRSVLIDLDQHTLSGIEGNFSITKVTERNVSFTGPTAIGGEAWGGMDRLSGSLNIWSFINGRPLYDYELVCKPARPLF